MKDILPKYRRDQGRPDMINKRRGGNSQSGAAFCLVCIRRGTTGLGVLSIFYIVGSAFSDGLLTQWPSHRAATATANEFSNDVGNLPTMQQHETVLGSTGMEDTNAQNPPDGRAEEAASSGTPASAVGRVANTVLLGGLSETDTPELVWEKLLNAPEAKDRGKLAVVEVGMHRAVQCLQAARAGFQAHCLEPSPRSFTRVFHAVGLESEEIQGRVHLHNVAAGSDESTVPFVAGGGTGDHVGRVDMWKMEKIPDGGKDSKGTVIQVPSRRLDTILGKIDEDIVYILKVDTQGFEPSVFSGLDNMLSKHKIQYILSEYWPRGMDVIAGEPDRACIGVKEILQKLSGYGYKLYALPVQSHPRAPAYSKLRQIQASRPMDDFLSNCRWYYDLETKYHSTEYKMGYWSDILAVSPNVDFSPESLA